MRPTGAPATRPRRKRGLTGVPALWRRSGRGLAGVMEVWRRSGRGLTGVVEVWRRCGRGLTGVVGVRRGGERGNAVVEFSWLAVLLLVPLVYAMIGVFDVQRASYGTTAAARAAGRAFVIVPPGLSEDEARSRAYEAARLAMRDQGMELDPGQVQITCDPACLEPGSTVTVRLDAQVPLPFIPHALGGEPPAVHVSTSHTEPYGDYRESKGNG